MTAKEFIFEQHDGSKWEGILISFAKYHVEKALKEVCILADEIEPTGELKHEFLKKYPLENIK